MQSTQVWYRFNLRFQLFLRSYVFFALAISVVLLMVVLCSAHCYRRNQRNQRQRAARAVNSANDGGPEVCPCAILLVTRHLLGHCWHGEPRLLCQPLLLALLAA